MFVFIYTSGFCVHADRQKEVLRITLKHTLIFSHQASHGIICQNRFNPHRFVQI